MNIEKNESYYFQIEDYMIHKKYILEGGFKLVNYLIQNNEDDIAFELMKRLSVHDNSKLELDEFSSLCKIPKNCATFKQSNCLLSKEMKNAISLHYQHNSHHPEHFENVEDMTTLDRMEMCCDWYARSLQYHTNFMEFVIDRQNNRFHFPEKMFQEILKYCKILNDD